MPEVRPLPANVTTLALDGETAPTLDDDFEQHDEDRWQANFAASQQVLRRIFDSITEEYETGRTIPIG